MTGYDSTNYYSLNISRAWAWQWYAYWHCKPSLLIHFLNRISCLIVLPSCTGSRFLSMIIYGKFCFVILLRNVSLYFFVLNPCACSSSARVKLVSNLPADWCMTSLKKVVMIEALQWNEMNNEEHMTSKRLPVPWISIISPIITIGFAFCSFS